MTSNTDNAARRLALLAGIVRDRAYHPQPYEIDRLVGLLESAAATAAVAPLEDGRRVPAVTLDTVQEAADLMEAHDFHIPASILGYVLAPALGDVPPMKALGAVTEQLARQDFDLQKRRNTVLHGDRLNSDDDETVAWALRALVTILYKHERLAAVVAVDNARPCNRGLTPFHLIALQQQAKKAAAKAGPTDGAKLIAALAAYSIPAFFAEDSGVSYVLVGVDQTADEGDAHTGPKVFLYSGENADLAPAEHVEPWTAALYDGEGEYLNELFTAQAGLTIEAECAHAALCLASWLADHADRYPRV
ncbi:hypothetical protein RVR_4455 [Actinacidiphila reveromycinica]|uniref:Uncharacterized protein n=1 Tax=Actinacidiphila reveromycinica TaxID=659352 RepID=A0A7U3UT93_9ACTN|nr:hypothetical protein [Streptomyces sp. SN-593]BBA98318.1 hypothetical protein RVR_4455 [Streptomyces sp. SN-593]